MATLIQALLLVSALPLTQPLMASAHMQMVWPIPFESAQDTAYYSPRVDYDLSSPLKADGSGYACKGYQNLGLDKVQATYTSGQTYNLTLDGTANHMGGSCQISLSYDNGASFRVIKSMVGGCPLKANWDFTVPEFAPSSDSALLAWTWFNLVGSRDMYMNCARVSIQSQPIQRYRRTTVKRQSSMNALPGLFACNIGNGCKTIEGAEVVFPNPGNNVEYGQDSKTPASGPGFTTGGTTPTGSAFVTASSTGISYVPLTTRTTAITQNASGASSAVSTSQSSVSRTAAPGIFVTSTVATSAATSQPIISPTPIVVASSALNLLANITTRSESQGQARTPTRSSTRTFEPTLSITNMLTSSIEFTNIATTTTTTTTISSTPTYLSSATIRATTSTLLPPISPSTSSYTSTISTTVPTTSLSMPVATVLSASCTPGTFACDSPSSFSQCVPSVDGRGTYLFMGPVAAGTQCVNGAIVRAGGESCSPDGALLCRGETQFMLCDHGGTVDMGRVAPGTACRNGVIVFA